MQFDSSALTLAKNAAANLYSRQFQNGIPCSGADIDEHDILSVVETALSGWFTEGKKCESFTRALKDFFGVRYALLTSSGSSANLLAISAALTSYKSKEHGRYYIVTTALGFPTTVAPIIQLGFIPLFVDVDPMTLNVNTKVVGEILDDPNYKVAGFVFAHTLGFPFDANAVRKAIDSRGLQGDVFFIEDCCDAMGATVDGKMVGSCGDFATLSFFPAHHITTGEGGCVLMNKPGNFKVARSMANWGRDCWCAPGENDTCGKRFSHKVDGLPEGWDHKYTFTNLGYNFKMTEFQAALGLSQMMRLEEFIQARKENYVHLMDFLDYYSPQGITYLEYKSKLSPFGFPIICTGNWVDTNKFIQHLEENGIRTRRVFGGNLARQPMLRDEEYEIYDDLEGTEFVMERVFWVGCWPGLTDTNMQYIGHTIVRYLDGIYEQEE